MQPLSVAVEIGDALPSDNVRTIGVDVIRQVDVLLVSGETSNRPLAGETDFMAIALSPFAFGGQDQPDAVRTTTINEGRLSKTLAQKSPDVVVLANVRRLSDDERSKIAAFVSSGGSLVIFDGDRVDTKSFNEVWGRGEAGWTLPLKLGDMVGGDASPDATTFPIGGIDPQYSPWMFLTGSDSGANGGSAAFSDIDVFGYRKLVAKEPTEPIDAADPTEPIDSTEPAAQALLSFANGDPLAVMASRGRGKVVQFAIPCDLAKTNLPTRLIFLPLIQQLTLDLAGSQTIATVDVGTPILFSMDQFRRQLDPPAKEKPGAKPTYTVIDPSGKETSVDIGDDERWIEVADTRQSGAYRLRRQVDAIEGDPIVTQTMRIASVPASESQLRDAEGSRMERVAELVGGSIDTQFDSLAADDQTRRFGREIWRWLLAALLLVMVGEVWLQQRSGGVSSTSKRLPLLPRGAAS